MDLDLKDYPRVEAVRDAFVFCCFTGLAFCDIKSLKRSDITTDADGRMWIRKHREKTGELSVIPLLDVPRRLIEKYRNHPKVLLEGVVLPVISNQRMNAYLRGGRFGKNQPSSHLAYRAAYLRNTFAEQPCSD